MLVGRLDRYYRDGRLEGSIRVQGEKWTRGSGKGEKIASLTGKNV